MDRQDLLIERTLPYLNAEDQYDMSTGVRTKGKWPSGGIRYHNKQIFFRLRQKSSKNWRGINCKKYIYFYIFSHSYKIFGETLDTNLKLSVYA